jgi:chromosome segregation ATPase
MSNGNKPGIMDAEIVNLIKEVASLKTTVDLSFENFNEMLNTLTESLKEANKITDENAADIQNLKKIVAAMAKNLNKHKDDAAKKSARIDKMMERFSKKIDWKKVSKILIIWAAILAAVWGIITHLSKIKDFIIDLLPK